MFTWRTFAIAKNGPQSKSPWAQVWINNNGIFKPDTAVKMNQILTLNENSKLKKYTVHDPPYMKFKNMKNNVLARNSEGGMKMQA